MAAGAAAGGASGLSTAVGTSVFLGPFALLAAGGVLATFMYSGAERARRNQARHHLDRVELFIESDAVPQVVHKFAWLAPPGSAQPHSCCLDADYYGSGVDDTKVHLWDRRETITTSDTCTSSTTGLLRRQQRRPAYCRDADAGPHLDKPLRGLPARQVSAERSVGCGAQNAHDLLQGGR